MKYGLIGEKLSHSFSARIHAALGYEYALKELKKEELADFFAAREFAAINVTIPYKQAVIPYLDKIDERAAKIGAVNTVVNRNGVLYGYNTDYSGLKALIEKNGVSLQGKTVLILGTGGTSLTAAAVAAAMGARKVLRVSRTQKSGTVTYAQAYSDVADAQVIINTTPVGMYPKAGETPIDPAAFSKLEAVFDAVYNPLSTRLVLLARERGLTAEGGLYMLVAQAVFASELFLDRHYPESVFEELFTSLQKERLGIVLIGMPGSGKTTVGKLLAEKMHLPFYDTDALVVNREKMEISDIFRTKGEVYFRDAESAVIKELAANAGAAVIATGGGAVLRKENVFAMRACIL